MDWVLGKKEKESSTYCPPEMKVPRDPEDPAYVMSFRVDQVEEYKKFFEEFGFVVIRDVLTKEECEASIDDIWNYLETRGWTNAALVSQDDRRIDRRNPATWIEENWPQMSNEGILGYPPVFTKVALQNRQNENVYKVWAELLGCKELLINHDRYGILQILTKSGVYMEETSSEYSDRVLEGLRYRTTMEFITENNEVGAACDNRLNMQGLINFADNREEDGGFHIVPGFKHHFEEWVKHRQHLKGRYGKRQTFIKLPDDEPIQKLALRITLRAGSMVIWDQRTAHGSAPNNSPNIRYAQFIKLFPAPPYDSKRYQARAEKVRLKVEAACKPEEITELGYKLFGLKPWNEEKTEESSSQ